MRSGVHELGVDGQIYLPLTQRPWLVGQLLIHSSSPQGVAAAIRQAIKIVDPDQAVAKIAPLTNVVSNQLEGSRTTTIVVACFGGCALFLVAVGIYGVVAYSVTQRRREIGIRMALGADRHRVRMLVVRPIFQMLALGFAVGLPGSFVVSRLYSSLLFATTPGDSTVLIATAVLLLAVTFTATYLPAQQATRLEPSSVLRAD
ncbi:MAG: FtsX-like permease family protein [Acidobacteriaceae bacterium]|nr:FtsX-like permease family protein [Acidobacteriaceae bacterium]MBV9296337.1 FtsX-like permease family protein [Acidobacteriaceae bacterium]